MTTSVEKLRKGLSDVLKATVADLEAHYADLRHRELKKSEKCAKCGEIHTDLKKCGDMSTKKSSIPLGKADVPMAKPPSGKNPIAPTTSKPTAPPKAPAAAGTPGLGKAETPMQKAGPRMGGRDPMSQGMTNAAMTSARTSTIPTGRAGPKLTAEDHARRASEMSAFTPAGAFSEPKGQGAAAGAMSAPSGLELAPKKSTIPTGKAPSAPMAPRLGKAEPSKSDSPKLVACETCGEKHPFDPSGDTPKDGHVSHTANPYKADVHNDKTPEHICSTCYGDAAQGV